MLNIFFINCFQVIVVSCNYTFSSVPLDPQPYTCRVCEIMAMYVVYQRTCLTQPHFCVCPKSEALAFVILYVFEWSSSICFGVWCGIYFIELHELVGPAELKPTSGCWIFQLCWRPIFGLLLLSTLWSNCCGVVSLTHDGEFDYLHLYFTSQSSNNFTSKMK